MRVSERVVSPFHLTSHLGLDMTLVFWVLLEFGCVFCFGFLFSLFVAFKSLRRVYCLPHF